MRHLLSLYMLIFLVSLPSTTLGSSPDPHREPHKSDARWLQLTPAEASDLTSASVPKLRNPVAFVGQVVGFREATGSHDTSPDMTLDYFYAVIEIDSNIVGTQDSHVRLLAESLMYSKDGEVLGYGGMRILWLKTGDRILVLGTPYPSGSAYFGCVHASRLWFVDGNRLKVQTADAIMPLAQWPPDVGTWTLSELQHLVLRRMERSEFALGDCIQAIRDTCAAIDQAKDK